MAQARARSAARAAARGRRARAASTHCRHCGSRSAAAVTGASTTPRALDLLAGLRPQVDEFFDRVLVNDPDAALRNNRLALLAQLRALFCRHRRSVAAAGLTALSSAARPTSAIAAVAAARLALLHRVLSAVDFLLRASSSCSPACSCPSAAASRWRGSGHASSWRCCAGPAGWTIASRARAAAGRQPHRADQAFLELGNGRAGAAAAAARVGTQARADLDPVRRLGHPAAARDRGRPRQPAPQRCAT